MQIQFVKHLYLQNIFLSVLDEFMCVVLPLWCILSFVLTFSLWKYTLNVQFMSVPGIQYHQCHFLKLFFQFLCWNLLPSQSSDFAAAHSHSHQHQLNQPVYFLSLVIKLDDKHFLQMSKTWTPLSHWLSVSKPKGIALPSVCVLFIHTFPCTLQCSNC